MKNKLLQLCVSFLVFFQIQAQVDKGVAYPSTADSYVLSSSADPNFGSDLTLQIKSSASGTANRKVFLKFDITGATDTYEQIVLRVVKSGGEELNITTQSTSTSWDESTIKWSNSPKPIKEVGQGNLRTADTLFVDITDYIKTKVNANQTAISLLLSSPDIIASPLKFHSKENGVALIQPNIIFFKTKHVTFPNVVVLPKPLVLSKYISSNMVIQRGKSFPFIGTAEPGATVTIAFVRDNVTSNASGSVAADGTFLIPIPAMDVMATPSTATISVSGQPAETITLDNIFIGDVWFAGGQSNMEKKVDYMLEATTVIADADNFKNIRAFRAEYNSVFDPIETVKPNNASWIVCDIDNVSKASAVAYIFAKKVYLATGIPIGIMQAYVGGTMIETWLSPDKIRDDKKLQFLEDRIPDYDKNDPKMYQTYPSVNYNGMVNPLRHFPIKGFLYYQGESNVKNAPEYAVMMKALIQDYRTKWNLGDIPFYFVQLANMGITNATNYEVTSNDETWQNLRQQQLLVAENSGLKNVGMAVIIETNEEHLNADANIRIHPHNKMPVGDRLSKIALKEQYGIDNVAYSPFVESTWVEGNKVFIRMKNVGTGLKIRTNEAALVGFAIGNESGTYYTATATIEEINLISVQTSQVMKPVYIAYGWSRDPICTLDNSENLPASPFRMALDKKKELQIIEDSFNQNGDQSSINSGTSIDLKVMLDGTTQKQIFIKIDISDLLFTTITNAKLKLTASAMNGTPAISGYTVNNNWTENQITWDNAPQLGQLIGTMSVNNDDGRYELKITDDLKNAIVNEELSFSIVLKCTNGSATFFSKEYTTSKPILVLNEDETILATTNFTKSMDGFLVYPNPVKNNILNIKSIKLEQSLPKVSIVNSTGQFFSLDYSKQGSERQLNLSRFVAGTYFLIIEADNQKFHKKIIIP